MTARGTGRCSSENDESPFESDESPLESDESCSESEEPGSESEEPGLESDDQPNRTNHFPATPYVDPLYFKDNKKTASIRRRL
ncbi:hypothetical protein, partial [Bhargavaea cecembensis]|uniref:hypothetical protein n=1 Tax=Bhargavaea cecembensis TaxID=394098 RepID=UPI001E308098